MCLFRQTTRHHLLALKMKFRLCIESSKICGFELLSFVETRHVNFMLQAFRLNDTCRCITTSTSVTQSKNYTCGISTVFWTVWVVGTWHHSTTGTSALGMIWTTSITTAPRSEGLGCTQFVQRCAINRIPVIESTDLLHDLRNILCRHTAHPRGERAQRLPQSQLCTFDKIGTSTICSRG